LFSSSTSNSLARNIFPSNFAAKDLVARYNSDGFVIVKNVLPADLVDEVGHHVDWLQKKYPKIPTEHLHHQIMRNDPFWVRVVSDPRLLRIAQAFLGNDIALFSSHYFCKLPKTGLPVLWHQDGSYWPLRPVTVITLWLAVDDSDTENGCMRVVRGTHTSTIKELKRDMATKNVLGFSTHEGHEVEPSHIVDLVLKRGDVSVHHPNIIHASEANTSTRRRCGLTIRYIPPSTECTDVQQPVMMLQGQEVPGINNYRSWPRYRPGYDWTFKGCPVIQFLFPTMLYASTDME